MRLVEAFQPRLEWQRRTAFACRSLGMIRVGKLLLLLTLWSTAPAWATVFELTDGDATQVVGQDLHVTTVYSDTLYDLARKYGVGSEEITRANPGIDPWLPGAGKDILIPGRRILPPGPREGIVVNIPEHRLYYYPKPKRHEKRFVVTYPVSIGKMDWKTPLGETHIVQKVRNPSWFPPASIRKEHLANGDPLPKVVPPGPKNPLGAFEMRLAVSPGDYLIHGTNNPLAVGMPVTHGCIRMYPEDVAALFPTVPMGTKVFLMNQPIKIAYVDGELLLEAHPPVDDQGQTVAPALQDMEQQLNSALGNNTVAIDWDYAIDNLKTANGIPATVGLEADLSTAPDEATPAEGVPHAAPVSAPAPAAAKPVSKTLS
jgi:L,D-transpeptidase ErfK/SrfK